MTKLIDRTERGEIDAKTATALKGLLKLKLDTVNEEMQIRTKAANLALRYPHLFGLEADMSKGSALGQLLDDE